MSTPRTPIISKPVNLKSPHYIPIQESIYNQLRQKISEYVSRKTTDSQKYNNNIQNCPLQFKTPDTPFKMSYKQYIDHSFENSMGNQYFLISSKTPQHHHPVRILQSPQKQSLQTQHKKPCLLLTCGIQMSIRNEKQKQQKPIKNNSCHYQTQQKKQRRTQTSQYYNQQIFYPVKDTNIQRISKVYECRKSMAQQIQKNNAITPKGKLNESPLKNIFQNQLTESQYMGSAEEKIIENISNGKISGYEQNSSLSRCEIEDYMNQRNSDFYQ